jgi:hypothetical protein
LENAFRVERNVQSKNMAMDTRRTTPNIYLENTIPYSKNTSTYKVNTSTIGGKKRKIFIL